MTLVALVSISLVLLFLSIKTTTLTQAYCLPDQRDALIQLKQGFNTTEVLHTWNAGTDCCIWDGITCDEQTGMVIEVNLFNRSISGELNPALFNLSSLQYLNLAFNNFFNGSLPQTGYERLGNLTHLDLSCSGFTGQVPIGISALTNLISLNISNNPRDLSTNFYSYYLNNLYLHDTSLKTLLSNLTKLQILYLDMVDISLNASEWGKAVSQVGPTLQKLSMQGCGLMGNFPDEIFNLTNLTELDLSDNPMFLDQLPDSIRNLQYLSILGLSNCNLYGEVPPSITNLTRLEYLNLGSNGLTGTIPMYLFSHPSMKSLDLSNNQLSGHIPEFSNGSSIFEYIDLHSNNIQGQLPMSIFNFPKLVHLDISSNNFTGTLNLDIIKHNKKLDIMDLSNNMLSIIEDKNHNESFYASFPHMSEIRLASCNLTKFPSFLRYQTIIYTIDLSNNKIDDVIPNWLSSKVHIEILNLSHNFFTKIEGHAHFTSLHNLFSLDIHSNRILGPLPLLPPGYIDYVDFSSNYFFSWPAYFVSIRSYLSISNNSLTGEIPLSICNATSLLVLDLSYNNLTGTIPACLLENCRYLEVLNLRSNKLSGSLSQYISHGYNFITIDLNGNGIHGSLPRSLLNCNALEILDLGNNQIVDTFPFWLGNLNNLRVLVLRSNQFYGTIPNMEANSKTNHSLFSTLKVFDISSNCFEGIIPKKIFQNLKAMGTNSEYSSTIPFGLVYYYMNSITVISKGQEMEIKTSLSIFSSLDLSQNGFYGEIPEDIGQLKSLDVLNLSHNALTGPIPSEFANLYQLQSLDLSSNQLSGHIPQEITSLTFLSSLNLSYNNLVGEVPEARQFSTFSNDSYLGNPGLCGGPLSQQCPAPPSNHVFNEGLSSKSSTDKIELSVSIGLGLGIGFAFVIWATVLWENGRKWFNFVIDGFYIRYFH
ncbi:receptor-like protein 49 [Carex rostrata]